MEQSKPATTASCVCIDASGWMGVLTRGKTYELTNIQASGCEVRGDDGGVYSMRLSRFVEPGSGR